MEFRGFKARWFLEYYYKGKWKLTSFYCDNTWEKAIAFCARIKRAPGKRYRVSSVALLLEEDN